MFGAQRPAVLPQPTSESISPAAPPPEMAHGSAQLLAAVFDRSPSAASVVGIDGRWLRINDAYRRLLGYELSDVLGAASSDFTHPDDVAEDLEFVAAAIAGRLNSSEREKRYVRPDGSIVWARVRTEIVRDQAGEPMYFVSHLQDITEQRTAQDLLRDSERTFRSVIDNTPSMISVKGRDHRYTLVNREFAQFFGVSSDWIIGRTDTELASSDDIEEVYAKDLLVLQTGKTSQDERTIVRDGRARVFLGTRFALLDERGEIHAVCLASTDITERRLEERAKGERLRCSELIYAALAQDRFVLHAQPIVNLTTMQPERHELLIRMLKVLGSDELLPPGKFLPAAERFDLIHVIDEWVIARAIELAAGGQRVTVNVSAKTISDSRRIDQIEQAVIAGGAPPENLVFEITETAVADNLEAARDLVTRLRALGCGTALDDFGVGHGTFTYLRHLPVDYLKIDMQFVRDLRSDDEDRQVVLAIVGVARQFKIETIAEGVEDQATLEALRAIGVDHVQGYWTGRPAPLPADWKVLRNRRRGDTYDASPD